VPDGVYRCRAHGRRCCRRADARTRFGISLGPLDGAIVTIKDLFDVAGEPTRAGSKVLADEARPAGKDAAIVRCSVPAERSSPPKPT
jgi:aspartyl-tRNA(Asn)/glutamyl-tRNA(Gln) amidotransferase subunit A